MMHLSINRPVAHDKFGLGFVTAIDREKITVDFTTAGRRKVHQAWLRAPSKGLLPYTAPVVPAEAQLAAYAGSGNAPFTVVACGIDEYVGATVAEFVIETAAGDLIAIPFFLEHRDPSTRRQGLKRFTEFSLALGIPDPDESDEYIGLRACFRVPRAGDFPTFARLAS